MGSVWRVSFNVLKAGPCCCVCVCAWLQLSCVCLGVKKLRVVAMGCGVVADEGCKR